eukprot:4975625-Alexandrium_andersonii.AAC.1
MQGATPARSAPLGAQRRPAASPAAQAHIMACEYSRRPDPRCHRAGVPCATPGAPRSLANCDL